MHGTVHNNWMGCVLGRGIYIQVGRQVNVLKAALHEVRVMRSNLLQLHGNVQQRVIPAPDAAGFRHGQRDSQVMPCSHNPYMTDMQDTCLFCWLHSKGLRRTGF